MTGKRLTDEERVAISDHDEQYLVQLGDALSMACGAVYDGMLAAGLRIVREDRTDPPMDELVAGLKALIRDIERTDDGRGYHSNVISRNEVAARIRELLP